MLDISKIIQYPFPETQYRREVYEKRQAVLHHTASGGGAEGDAEYWKSNLERIATPFIIERDGDIYQLFSSKYYAAHLGIPQEFLRVKGFNDYKSRCDLLHKMTIGIEIDSWGWLNKKGKKYYSWQGAEVPECNVQFYPNGFKGFKYYEKYTVAQLQAVKDLLEYLCKTYKISSTYNPNMWSDSIDALSGKSGIWAHVSYRKGNEKTDVHPQPELIEVLKSLTS